MPQEEAGIKIKNSCDLQLLIYLKESQISLSIFSEKPAGYLLYP